MSETVEKWDVFEYVLKGPDSGNPFMDVKLSAEFSYLHRVVKVNGFYDGDGTYLIRFMPDTEGRWEFTTLSNVKELNAQTGAFECTAPAADNHGPVRVSNKYHFSYEDGVPFFQVGTTAYVWNHQGSILEKQTMDTLKTAPFNKIRMCIFPKDYDYNRNDPPFYPFIGTEKNGAYTWDFERFNPAFFQHLEKQMEGLMQLNIEADLILFHPYDRWGFASMGKETDDFYLGYVAARLSAYRNVWWSMANEYDLMTNKDMADWDRLFKLVQAQDPYQHLRSIHNWRSFYDHRKPWVTHCSIQSFELNLVDKWRDYYGKPVVIDECRYEGDLNHIWGNLTGEELVRCFWEGTVRGGYVGHGETYLNEDEVLWWSRGGVLRGKSTDRLAFLRKIMEDGPQEGIEPFENQYAIAGVEGKYYLQYFGITQPAFLKLEFVSVETEYEVDVIDTWNMTIERAEGTYTKGDRIELPGEPYIALRIMKREGE